MTKFRVALAGLAGCMMLLTAAVVSGQSADMDRLKGPIARAGLTEQARSVARLWRQVSGTTPVAPAVAPESTPSLRVPVGAIQPADRAALLGPGYERDGGHIPATAKPDNVGAFRFICTAGPLNWDDAIVYPGQIGASPHLHQNYGNTDINGKSTHESLLVGGDSTCSNALNRSAYWVPALITGDGKHTIRPDWINIYYKRLPASDPGCLTLAKKGCVGLPTGLRLLSGFDMKRMGEKQPENLTFSHRCATDGKPSIHRKLLAEAVADCGGHGQIVSQVEFGNCWDGRLDSPDHRKHVAFGGYGSWGYYRCPSSHAYAIPQLVQLVAFTIEQGDGDIYFASDRMGGMNMPGGSTFHADYIEAWDAQTRKTWETNCLDKLLSCSDGELGDGTMMKRQTLTYKADPRVVAIPAKP